MIKSVKKMLGSLLLTVILITAMLPAYAETAEAATNPGYKIFSFQYGDWGEPEKVKIYGKYYWNDSSSIYCASTQDGEGKVIATAPDGYMIDDCIITNGSRIYYDVKPTNYSKEETVFYYVPNSGKTKPVKIKSVKSNSWLASYYSSNGNLYTYKYNSSAEAYQLYSLNVKTKQYKRVNSNFRVIGATGGSRYIYGASNQFQDGLKIFDAKSGKLLRKIKPEASKDPNSHFGTNNIVQAMVSNGKLYYLELGYYERIVFETSLSGKTTPKVLFREFTGDSFMLANGKFYYCDSNGDYFTFDLKTKETKPSSMDAYDEIEKSRVFN